MNNFLNYSTNLNYSRQSTASLQTHEDQDNLLSQNQQTKKFVSMTVYYTPILRDPVQMNKEPGILSKQYKLQENSFIFCHKENSKIKITQCKQKARNILQENQYTLVAQMNFKEKPNLQKEKKKEKQILIKEESQKNFFSLSRKLIKSMSQNSSKFIFHTPEEQKSQKQKMLNDLVFYLVKNKSYDSINFPIKSNELIKFGKQIYKVKLYPKNENPEKKLKIFQHSILYDTVYRQNQIPEVQCKICLMVQGQHQKDFIVSPCKCAGSCSAIHIQCLKHWIQQKIQVSSKQKKLKTYDLSKFECEICKFNYPKIIQVSNNYIDTVPQMSLQKQILVLQKLHPLTDQKKIFHVISLQNGQNITIGRNHQNELMLEDMSVSRSHASILKGQNGEFYISDKDSRFGTFISLTNQLNNLNQALIMTSKQTFLFKMQQNQNKDPIQVEDTFEGSQSRLNDILDQS